MKEKKIKKSICTRRRKRTCKKKENKEENRKEKDGPQSNERKSFSLPFIEVYS